MWDWLSGIAQGIGNIAKDIGNSLTSIGQTILDGIKAIFVPDEDFITERWNAIRARFSFADSISETADIIIRFFKETAFNEPPKIYMNLSHAESKYNYGTDAYCLDMSWYARYKPIVDSFLSGWIWLCFIYRVYTKLPAIIGGVAGDFQTVNQAYESRNYTMLPPGHKKGGKK